MRSLQSNRRYGLGGMFFALVLFLVATSIYAGPVTSEVGVPDLAAIKKFETIPNFKIGGKYEIGNPAAYEFGGTGGVTLESLGKGPLRTAYIAVGTPKKNDAGKIINAIIINSYYSGDSSFFYNFWYDGRPGNGFCKGPVVGPGKLFDTDKYYIIFLDALGLWGASKPSDGLGMKFPMYSVFDQVQANYRLLKDKLGVDKVLLATGVSMGGTQTYAWGLLHPEFVDAIMPIGGQTTNAGDTLNRWLFRLMTAALQSDPVWQKTKGDYYHLPKEQHPNQGVMFGWSILLINAFDFDFRVTQPWDTVRKDVFSWEPKGEDGTNQVPRAKIFDANDLIYRNESGDTLDFNEHLGKIKAKTLVVHVKNDHWLRYKLAEKSAAAIPGAKIVGFEDPLAHYGVFMAPNMVKDQIAAFLTSVGITPGGVAEAPKPPAKKFAK